jgi:hypothetical protein
MIAPAFDDRRPSRKARDEEIASQVQLPPLELPSGAAPLPVEAHMARHRRPIAVAGVVKNGLVRPLDPGVHLPEHSRVIIVTAENT